MILWQKAVTDRSQGDADIARSMWERGYFNLATVSTCNLGECYLPADLSDGERARYDAGLKGSLNKADLLRIENDIQLLSDVLELGLTTYYNNIPACPNETYYNNLLSNVGTIRAAYMKYTTTPSTPSAPLNIFTKWNNVEQILKDVYTILNSNLYYYTGEGLYSGQEIGLL